MKNFKWAIPAILSIIFVLASCNKDEEVENTIPQNFKVDIPSSISSSSNTKSAKDTMAGGEVYAHLRTFIHVGEGAADIVQDIMQAISQYELNQEMSFDFVSDDDNRTKNVVIVENSDFDGTTWEFQLTMTDAESESNEDGGVGMQVFWNTDPVKGIAILKPSYLNFNETEGWSKAIFRVDYSEAGESGYEKHMIVSIAELPVADADVYAIETLKMFVGKNGDIIDVYGNSNHPNATFFNQEDQGFNWAFVAAGDEVLDIAVAEVGLPMSNLDITTRSVILEDYSIFNVFSGYIGAWYTQEYGGEIPQDILDDYLQNTQAPGFFNNSGFVAAQNAPTDQYTTLISNIAELTPYNPKDVSNLSISFKANTPAK